jgi:hypothetical protein
MYKELLQEIIIERYLDGLLDSKQYVILYHDTELITERMAQDIVCKSEYINEGEWSSVVKSLKNRAIKITKSQKGTVLQKPKRLDYNQIDKIKRIRKRNHQLFLNGKINADEYRKRIHRLNRIESSGTQA